jgi:phosphatidylglycerophosphate synthase
MRSVIETPTPRWRDFLATNRGGGLYSEAVSQPLGAALAVAGYRLGLPPTALTMLNLVCGVGGSVVVIMLAAPANPVPSWLVGVIALLAWQFGYALDCADGQLARVTGQAGPAGARLDILCDLAVQVALVTALSVVAVRYRPGTPIWLPAAFAGVWMVNLLGSVLQSGPQAASLMPSRSVPVRLVKLVRDYGAIVLVAGLVLAVMPQWTVLVLWAFTASNGLFLLASIASAARAALAAPSLAPPSPAPSPVPKT